jgi:RNA polymerase sigma factor (sigma-70 family)
VRMQPFEEVVAEHGEVVMRVCRALLRPADADDAWSETFLSAMRAYPALRADSNIRGWLVTIAHRKALDVIRRTKRVDPVANVPEQSRGGDVPDIPDHDLRDALAALPPKQRAAVVLHYLGDLPYTEVGFALDTSAAAARRSAADGIANLRITYLSKLPEKESSR